MQTLRFKTSLKCKGCVNAIKPSMDKINDIKTWRVFLDVQEKILEVDLDNYDNKKIENTIIETVIKAGYNIERI